MTYYKRSIDKKLLEWKVSQRRKPLLIRGARQVGKSSAVRQLGKEFKYFVEINLESQPSIRGLFSKDIDVHRTCESIRISHGTGTRYHGELQAAGFTLISASRGRS